jgi:hypothetical protein
MRRIPVHTAHLVRHDRQDRGTRQARTLFHGGRSRVPDAADLLQGFDRVRAELRGRGFRAARHAKAA